MRRPRGPGGRFLTSDEVAEMDRKKAAGIEINMDDFKTEKDFAREAARAAKSAPKRKAEPGLNSMAKKAKSGGPVKLPSPEEDDEDDDEDDG